MELINKVYLFIDHFREMLHFPKMGVLDFIMVFSLLLAMLLYNLPVFYFQIVYKIFKIEFKKEQVRYSGDFNIEKKLINDDTTNNNLRRCLKIGLFFINLSKPFLGIGFILFIILVLKVVFRNIK